MKILADSLQVLTNQSFLIGCLLIIMFSGTMIVTCFLRKATKNSFGEIEYFSLGISGWVIPILLWAFLSSIFPAISLSLFIVIVLAGLLCVFPLLKSMRENAGSTMSITLGLSMIFLFSIIVNLAFISQTIFPAYFDSIEHYRIIKLILEAPSSVDAGPISLYYHIGYHLILAAVVQITNAGIIDVMLTAGQLGLSILGVSLFFIIKRETASNSAAFFTTLLAGFGWYMPAHAINWGKYPAIFGLICIIFVFNLLYLILPKNSIHEGTKRLIPMLVIAIGTATVIHTRSFIVCGLFASALFLANTWETSGKFIQRSLFALLILILLAFGFVLRNDGTFLALLSSYWENDVAALFLVLLLAGFAIWKFPKFTFSLFLFTVMLLSGLFIPVDGLFGYENLFLLDRPYVQMLLFIVFSLLGGLGAAGLFKAIKARLFIKQIIQAGAFGFLVINAILYQDYYPSKCCQLAGSDDVAAFSWIQQELAPHANLLIASQDLPFTPDSSLLSTTGIDAGIWIPVITGRNAFYLPGNTDFTLPDSRITLCKMYIEYIYVGNRSESFNENGLLAKPEWYQPVFLLPNAKIYRFTGCS